MIDRGAEGDAAELSPPRSRAGSGPISTAPCPWLWRAVPQITDYIGYPIGISLICRHVDLAKSPDSPETFRYNAQYLGTCTIGPGGGISGLSTTPPPLASPVTTFSYLGKAEAKGFSFKIAPSKSQKSALTTLRNRSFGCRRALAPEPHRQWRTSD